MNFFGPKNDLNSPESHRTGRTASIPHPAEAFGTSEGPTEDVPRRAGSVFVTFGPKFFREIENFELFFGSKNDLYSPESHRAGRTASIPHPDGAFGTSEGPAEDVPRWAGSFFVTFGPKFFREI